MERKTLKRLFYFATILVGSLFLCACSRGNGLNGEGAIEDATQKMPADLSEEDLKIVDELNSESNLPYNLYQNIGELDEILYPYQNVGNVYDMGDIEEPLEIQIGENSTITAVRIPKDEGVLRAKEFDLKDKEFNVYGMSVGVSKSDFEEKMKQKNFEIESQIESMGYEAFINGNIYIAITYDETFIVDSIFVNFLADYNEWRGVE